MTILRIYLFAMISTLFLFGGSRGADASSDIRQWYSVCSEGYKQYAAPCEGKKTAPPRPRVSNIARKNIAQSEKPRCLFARHLLSLHLRS
jgi:hypothetical protein